jgi:hypothetical protein
MALRTYLFLRVSMIGVIVALGISVVTEVRSSHGCFQRSISAYYYTPTRAVFVASLVTLGVCMIVLWGKNWVEDGALNLAGMLAPVVAFVPTSDANFCSVVTSSGTTLPAPQGNNPTGPTSIINGAQPPIDNNVTAYFTIIAIALIGLVVLAAIPGLSELIRDGKGAWISDHSFYIPWGLAVVLWAFGMVMYHRHTETFYDHAHDVSATTLFVFIMVVVFSNAWAKRDEARRQTGDAQRGSRRWMWAYGVLGLVMVVAAVAIWGLGRANQGNAFGDHWVLIIEASLISLFALFWMLQTVERRNEGAPATL